MAYDQLRNAAGGIKGRPEQGQAPKTILITGGAGFLGSHLCERLLAQGNQVIALDNFSTGRRDNITHLAKAGLVTIEHDISMPISWEDPIDLIYNLACPASPKSYQADPIHTMKTCVVGAINVLELALQHDATVLQASTSEVYGDPGIHPQPESYFGNVNPVGPRSCYDEGKRAAETLFREYRRVHGMRTATARIFNTYGPRMQEDDGRVVSNFIIQALRGRDLTIYGTGRQTRSFCYVDDLLEGMVRLASAADGAGDPVNLGNPGEFTILELAELVVELTGSRSRLVHCDLPVDDPRQRCPDISKAADLLGWQPRIALREGLTRTIAYFDRLLRADLSVAEMAK